MTTRFLALCCAALLFAAGIPSQAAPQRPPAKQFFQHNVFYGAALSPDGSHLAALIRERGESNVLAVINLETRQSTTAAAYFYIDIGSFQWVNNERLVFTRTPFTVRDTSRWPALGLFAVNRDGSQLVQLANDLWTIKSTLPQSRYTYLLDQPGSQDSEFIYVSRPYFDKNGQYTGTGLLRLNTLTGDGEVVREPPVRVDAYRLDAQGKPRLAMANAPGKSTLFYRSAADDKWLELAGFEHFKDKKKEIDPLGFGPDGSLYVIANGGDDLASLRTFDLATKKLHPEPVVSTVGYDFSGTLVSSDKLLGVRLTTDARNNIWFDQSMKTLQATIDKALPGTVNLLTVAARPGSPFVLVESYSDRQPAFYSLYDSRTGAFDRVATTFPAIDPAQMGRQEPIRFKARDGLDIPGLLTLPPGSNGKNLPMVVLVHGGPWVRGSSWGWDADTQFLATRGYAVLEVEFRGSLGFGVRHFEAGMRQWGLAMQNDIADGTRWAIAQGLADPRRICIAGASYGGYAALMGVVNDPELYQCAFEWLGVTDIGLMYRTGWDKSSDMSETFLRYGMPVLVGDQEKDALQLKATSPLEQAARIQKPLLLAYGGEDKRVPLEHGQKFYEAVKKTNKRVDLLVYKKEGHGWAWEETRLDFWRNVERFLDRHIGPQRPTDD